MEWSTRSGHIADVALDAWVLGELDSDTVVALEEHVSRCERCAAAWAEVQEDQAQPGPGVPWDLIEAAPQQDSPVVTHEVSAPANQSLRWFLPLLTLAAAALLVVGLQARGPDPAEEPEHFRLRGGEVSLEVLRKGAEGAVPLASFDTVAPGDTLGFKVNAKTDGYLLVYGVDGTGERYPAFPRGASPAAAPVDVGEHPLDAAIQLDDAPGDETFSAVLCKAPFDFASVPEEGCSTALLPLRKKAP